jgi:hypothetical protein
VLGLHPERLGELGQRHWQTGRHGCCDGLRLALSVCWSRDFWCTE